MYLSVCPVDVENLMWNWLFQFLSSLSCIYLTGRTRSFVGNAVPVLKCLTCLLLCKYISMFVSTSDAFNGLPRCLLWYLVLLY